MSDELVRSAQLALQQKNWPLVVSCARKLIEVDIDAGFGHYLLGMAKKSQRQFRPAFEAFQRAVKANSKLSMARLEGAEIKQMFGEQNFAIKWTRQALGSEIQAPIYLTKAGNIFARAGLHQEACSAFEKALELSPGSSGVKMSLAGAFSKTGELEQSKALYMELLEAFPDHQRMHYELAKLGRVTDRTHIDRMLDVLKSSQNGDEQNIFLLFALGKELEDLEDWKSSFQFYKRGNDAARNSAQKNGFHLSLDIDPMTAFQKNFSAQNCTKGRSVSAGNATPIFIVGLPRSGTTLLEKIVTGHAQVESIDESFFLENAIRAYCKIPPQQNLMPHHIEHLANSHDTAKILENYYIWSEYRRTNKKFFIEKYPMNFQYLGLITRHLPEAKILLMNRNPMDVCFALYKQPHFRFALDLEDVGEYYAAYAALIKHWEAVIGDRMHPVQYEDLIANPAETIRSAMSYLGLKYSDDLLNFHERKETSASASSSQIREKMHARSVGKWKNWKTELAPLSKKLSEYGLI